MKKTVVFIWNYKVEPIHLLYWWDGLRAALDKLNEYYNVHILTAHNIEDIPKFKPDAILVWGTIDSPLCSVIESFGVPSAFLYAGGPKDHANYKNFNHIFYESESDGEDFRKLGYSISRAFGVNTELFSIQKQPKIFDAIFPATFAKWKRHDVFARALKGRPALACGFWQGVEEECRTVCTDNGILVTKAIHPEALVSLYNASRCTFITSDSVGGSQRAVLESLACGVPVVIMDDNEKCKSLFWAETKWPDGVYVLPPDVEVIKRELAVILTRNHDKEELRKLVTFGYSEDTYLQQLKNWLDNVINIV